METREKSRKTNTDALEIEGRQQGGAGAAHALAHDANRANPDSAQINLERILEEIQNFRKENNRQLDEIKIELNKTNQRIGHAEDRIEGIETRVQNVEETMKKMIKMQSQLESKQIDQEGRSRRDNIRIYNVPEDIEKNSMNDYVEQLLRDTLDFPPDTELHVERAHRALVPKPGKNARPRSIVVKFLRYKMKEEVIRKAWAKKDIFVGYHTAEDAYLDMVKRGFHVEKTPLTESLMEQLDTRLGRLRHNKRQELKRPRDRQTLEIVYRHIEDNWSLPNVMPSTTINPHVKTMNWGALITTVEEKASPPC
ncbi:LINE-1 type transposase domain-containing protein 1 [Labeo rohita]|uniref:LINE-1 type transposase domain-containing protein 1 n=1 Tax=Labeo rohita TaxID=84645 RepID=A0ABQ8MBQ4_LABRO|nr:LINE-1 type transposase domain-containing protein 1 [Labeo rohita]